VTRLARTHRLLAAAAAATTALGAGVALAAPGAPLAAQPAVPVVVRTAPGATAAVESRVVALRGTVRGAVPLVDGVVATVPASSLRALAASPGVLSVAPDAPVRFASTAGTTWESAGATTLAATSDLPRNTYLASTGAKSLQDRGVTGKGVTVAVLDTGITPVPDLAGRVDYGPDLSTEQSEVDTFGHGTAMAGLIAGSGVTSPDPAHPYVGVAPGARLVSVKAAGRDGATDVGTVLRGLQWVSTYASQYGIRVLNLSMGAHTTADPAHDPLSVAVERLWQQGIVVVVSAGNEGAAAGTVTSPGSDPLALTVGAFDEGGTARRNDDAVPAWSSRGPTAQGLAKPDLVAPGRTVVTLRSPGSRVEADNPLGLVGRHFIKGSGTSEAAAVTSGVVALMLQDRPQLTPDQVKRALVATARPISGAEDSAQGSGRIAAAAATEARPGLARRQQGVVGPAAPPVPTQAWQGGAWTPAAQDSTAWDGSSWNGSAWTGSAWDGSAWTGSAWTGSAWTGSRWDGSSWNGSAWTGSAWDGSAWTGSAWDGSAWTGSAWTGSAWTGSAWTGSAWTGSRWDGSAWTSAFFGDAPRTTGVYPGEPGQDAPVELPHS